MPIERETIVTDGGRSGIGSGVVIGIIVVFLLLVLIGGVTVDNGGFSFGGHPVTVELPKVTVSK